MSSLSVRRAACSLTLLTGLMPLAWAQAPSASTQPGSEAATSQPADASGPRIEVSPAEFNFGQVWQGAPAEGTFTVKNAGTEALTISARSSCGCTVASKPKSPLGPGESTTFTISYKTSRKGPAGKKVTLTTNDPTNERVVIPVVGEVKSLFEIKPSERLTFSNLEVDTKTVDTITLKNMLDRPVMLKLRDTDRYERFNIDIREVRPGQDYAIMVETKPPLRPGWNRATIVLETDMAEVPRITLSANAHVPPEISVSPTRLYVTSNMTQAASRIMRVIRRTDSSIEITGVSATPAAIQCELLPPDEDMTGPADGGNMRKTVTRRVRVNLPGFADMPPEGGKLEILTNSQSENYRRLEVPILRRALPDAPQAAKPLAPPADKAGQAQAEPVDQAELRRRIEEALRQATQKKADQPAGAGNDGTRGSDAPDRSKAE